MRAKIKYISGYVPERIITCYDIEKQINENGEKIPYGSLERLFGIKERRFAEEGVQTSDLAVKAALPVLKQVDKSSIDCMIFAAVSGDLIEPATANIVQDKLRLTCPVFDVKNACNSFVNGIQIASSFVQSGQYKNVLIVTGEILHHAIKFDMKTEEDLKKRLASYTLGDAGAAALVTASTDESGIIYQNFRSVGKHWPLCTILGGGSMFPHDLDKYYFEGHTAELREVLLQEKGNFVAECLQKTGWDMNDIDVIFTHQVSMGTFDVIAKTMGLSTEKFVNVVHKYGNTAAASIPLAMYEALNEGKLKKGDKVLVLGLAAGISIAIQTMIW